MTKLLQNIGSTSMYDIEKSLRDSFLFAFAMFLTTFISGLDPHSVFANTSESMRTAAMNGIDAVYSSWLALLMPMLMRTLRSGKTEEGTNS